MGRHIKDPKGWHATFAFKFADEVDREFHYTSHGYTSSKHNYTLREAVSKPPKPDSTPRGGKRSGKVVWAAEDVTEWKDSPIGYSHLGE